MNWSEFFRWEATAFTFWRHRSWCWVEKLYLQAQEIVAQRVNRLINKRGDEL